jgi:hypothetical protein
MRTLCKVTEMSNDHNVQTSDDEVGPEMPALLRYISTGVSLALVALSWATAWVWFPDSGWGKATALFLFVAAAPPITVMFVLEIANRLTGGELKRTGRLVRKRT